MFSHVYIIYVDIFKIADNIAYYQILSHIFLLENLLVYKL